MTNGILWTIIGLHVLGALITISQVGKPKKPTTPGVAAVSTAISALIIVGLVYVAGQI